MDMGAEIRIIQVEEQPVDDWRGALAKLDEPIEEMDGSVTQETVGASADKGQPRATS